MRPGGQLAKHLKQEAKCKMMAVYQRVKNNCEGIKEDASLEEIETNWQDSDDDDICKAMKDKDWTWMSWTSLV